MRELWEFFQSVFTEDMAEANVLFLGGLIFTVWFLFVTPRLAKQALSESEAKTRAKLDKLLAACCFCGVLASIPEYLRALWDIQISPLWLLVPVAGIAVVLILRLRELFQLL